MWGLTPASDKCKLLAITLDQAQKSKRDGHSILVHLHGCNEGSSDGKFEARSIRYSLALLLARQVSLLSLGSDSLPVHESISA